MNFSDDNENISGIPAMHCKIDPKSYGIIESEIIANHYERDIFFRQDLHNNLMHALLSQYALGMNGDRLKKEWKQENYLEALRPKREIEITMDNWEDYLGDDSFYHNYLDFFDEQIKQNGSIATLKKFMFNEKFYTLVLSRCMHALIRLGFGIEFESPLLVSEGLADAAINDPSFSPLIEGLLLEDPTTKSLPLNEIIELVRNDKVIDGLITFNEVTRTKEKAAKLGPQIKRYARHFVIEKSAKGIQKALRELYSFARDLYGTTGFHPSSISNPNYVHSDVKLDFYLMHLMTSILAVRQILPHISISRSILLLKSHFSVCLLYYIARGRPILNYNALMSFQLSIKSWEEIIQLTQESKDVHLANLIRSLVVGREMFNEKVEDKNGSFFRIAALTVEWMVKTGHEWNFSGSGFIESWKEGKESIIKYTTPETINPNKVKSM